MGEGKNGGRVRVERKALEEPLGRLSHSNVSLADKTPVGVRMNLINRRKVVEQIDEVLFEKVLPI